MHWPFEKFLRRVVAIPCMSIMDDVCPLALYIMQKYSILDDKLWYVYETSCGVAQNIQNKLESIHLLDFFILTFYVLTDFIYGYSQKSLDSDESLFEKQKLDVNNNVTSVNTYKYCKEKKHRKRTLLYKVLYYSKVSGWKKFDIFKVSIAVLL